MKMKESKTIEAVAAIIRGDQPKRKKKLRGSAIGFRNRGMIWSLDHGGTQLKR
jgi:hypothetical protein